MNEFEKLGLNVEHPEILGRRNLNSKTFDLGDNRHRLISHQTPLHYEREGRMLDLDLTPVDKGTYWVVEDAPFKLTIDKTSPKFEYHDRDTDIIVLVELQSVDDVGVSFTQVQKDCGFIFTGISGNDLHFNITASGIATGQLVKEACGCKSLLWKIEQNTPEPLVTEVRRSAVDKSGDISEILVERSELIKQGALWTHSFKEKVTGVRLQRDPETRKLMRQGESQFEIKATS